MKNVFPAFLVVLFVVVGCRVERPATDDDIERLDATFDQVRSDYLADYWQHHPIQAAQAGLTAFNDRLPALTAVDIAHQIDQIQASLEALESMPVEQINDPARQNEWHRLRSHARERLLDLGELRQWQRDPGLYVPATAFEVLLDPKNGSVEDRAAWLLTRLHQLPTLLQAGRTNLNAPPQRFTLDAIHRADSLVERLDQAVPELASAATGLRDELIIAGEMAASELQVFSLHLREHVLPDSSESAAVGRDLYQRYLVEVHQISHPPEAIIAMASHAFADIERELSALATAYEDATHWTELPGLLNENPALSESDRTGRLERLNGLVDELLQSARMMLDARIHTRQISVDEARHFLSDHLHMDHDKTGTEVRQFLDHPGGVFNPSHVSRRSISSRLMADGRFSPGFPVSADEHREEY